MDNFKFYNNRNIEPTPPWYHAKEFSHFWMDYSALMFYAHKNATIKSYDIQKKIEATFPFMVSGLSPVKPSGSPRASRSRGARKREKRRRKKQRRRVKRSADESSRISSEEEGDESAFILTDDDALQVRLQKQMHLNGSEEEVDNDFLEFMEKSVKHRIRWTDTKNKTKQTMTDERSSSASEDLDEEHPDDVTSRQMCELYGSAAASIRGMETAMQLSFDRISTLHQPAIWPNIPLKLIF